MTVKQPWAWLIAQGIKKVENRSWKTNYRGTVAIHVGKSNDVLNNKDVIKWIEKEGIFLPSEKQMRSQQGKIIALVQLVGIVSDSSSPWAIDGQFHWQLENVCQIDPSIPAKGKLGLWNFPIDKVLP